MKKPKNPKRFLKFFQASNNRPVFIMLLLFSPSLLLKAQPQIKIDTIDISKIQFSAPLQSQIINNIPDSIANSENPYFLLPYQNSQKTAVTEHAKKIVEKNIFLDFELYNSSDSTGYCYFFPGSYFTGIQLFKISNGTIIDLIKPEADENLSSGLALIRLKGKEKASFIAKLTTLKSGVSILSPEIVDKDFVKYFKENLGNTTIIYISYFVSGILLMMLLYSLVLYFQDYKPEFLYYSLYAFFTGLLLFLKSFLYNKGLATNYYFEGWGDFMLQGVGLIFYISFIRKFLQTAKVHPLPEKIFWLSQWLTIALLLAFSLAYFFSNSYLIPDIIETSTKLLLIAISIFFIVYGIPKKNRVLNFLIAGQIMLIFLSISSYMLLIIDAPILKPYNNLLNEPLLYYEAGIAFELFFFLLMLANKNKRELIDREKERILLRLENEKKELEKQFAIIEAKNEERSRIASDMHDDLGAGISAIRLLSEIAKTKTDNQVLPEIEKISHSTNELEEKMNSIIWAMNIANDNLENLIFYIRSYAVELFDNTKIDCRIYLPTSIPEIEINGKKRRHIFLSIKEALNNIIKHAHASKVQIKFLVCDKLHIEINDDGQGINLETLRKFGNGLNNMKKRMESIDGTLQIQNQEGTKLTFTVGV